MHDRRKKERKKEKKAKEAAFAGGLFRDWIQVSLLLSRLLRADHHLLPFSAEFLGDVRRVQVV